DAGEIGGVGVRPPQRDLAGRPRDRVQAQDAARRPGVGRRRLGRRAAGRLALPVDAPPPVGPDAGGGEAGGGGGGLEASAAAAPAHSSTAAKHAAASARSPMPDLEIPTSTATFEPEMSITSS